MEARAKLLGHSVHQMLIPIPLGLFTTATALDIVSLFVRAPGLGVASFWNLAIAIGAGLLAAVFGAMDWTAIPRGTRAKRIGALHALANVATLSLFAVAVWIRHDELFFRAPAGALVIETVALGISLVAAWFGGELIDRLGIGIDDGAHPNAPSSLSGSPISDDARTMPHIAHPEHVGASTPDVGRQDASIHDPDATPPYGFHLLGRPTPKRSSP